MFCLSLGDWLEDRRELDALRHRLFDLIEITPNLEWLLLTKRPENFDKLARGSWVTQRCPDNVRVGVSAEDQPRADERLPRLLRIPANNFVSIEPLLGPVRLAWEGYGPYEYGYLREGVQWVIVGGESGAGARSFNLSWARSIVRQCKAVGVPVFVKQLGSRPDGWWTNEFGPRVNRHSIRDKKGGDPFEWPEDLRVREFPR